MKKYKTIIYGISDGIWSDMKNNLNFSILDIQCFIDNNKYSEGLIYEGIAIKKYSDETIALLKQCDIVLITAYSAYQEIYFQLIKDGIDADKIHLYLSKGIKFYPIGSISPNNRNHIDEIYIDTYVTDPETGRFEMYDVYSRQKDLNDYLAAYAEYSNDSRVISNPADRWCADCKLIAHACGGYAGGEKRMYSDCKEALQWSLKQSYKVIECDLVKIGDNIFLGHQAENMNEAVSAGLTIITLQEAIEIISHYPGKKFLVDVKWNDSAPYMYYVDEIVKCIDSYKDEEVRRNLYNDVVMEAYDEDSIRYAKESGFDVFFTLYRLDSFNIYNISEICIKNDVPAIGFGFGWMLEHVEKISTLFHKRNIRIYGYSTDSITDYRIARAKGLDGVFTNFLASV